MGSSSQCVYWRSYGVFTITGQSAGLLTRRAGVPQNLFFMAVEVLMGLSKPLDLTLSILTLRAVLERLPGLYKILLQCRFPQATWKVCYYCQPLCSLPEAVPAPSPGIFPMTNENLVLRPPLPHAAYPCKALLKSADSRETSCLPPWGSRYRYRYRNSNRNRNRNSNRNRNRNRCKSRSCWFIF